MMERVALSAGRCDSVCVEYSVRCILCGWCCRCLLKHCLQFVGHISSMTVRWLRISLEIVVQSWFIWEAIFLKDKPSCKSDWIVIRSSRTKCLKWDINNTFLKKEGITEVSNCLVLENITPKIKFNVKVIPT